MDPRNYLIKMIGRLGPPLVLLLVSPLTRGLERDQQLFKTSSQVLGRRRKTKASVLFWLYQRYSSYPCPKIICLCNSYLPIKTSSQSARFCISLISISTHAGRYKNVGVDPRVVDHAENEYRRAHVRRWGVSEIQAKNAKFSL